MFNHRAERIKKLLADLVAFDTVSDRSNLPLISLIGLLAACGGSLLFIRRLTAKAAH